MGANKEYYLRLQEEHFESLPFEEQRFLIHLGTEVRQKETEIDKDDKHYQELKKARVKSWNEEQEYLFKKRNNMHGS
jgi:hypothetical protein